MDTPKILNEIEMLDEAELKYQFDEKKLTIRELMADQIAPKDMFETESMKVPISWTKLIAIVNRKLKTTANHLNLDSEAVEAFKAYSILLKKNFSL